MRLVVSLSLVAFAALSTSATPAAGQRTDSVRVAVRVESEGSPVAHASVRSEFLATQTNAAGLARLTFGLGRHQLIVAALGYAPDTLDVRIEIYADTTLRVELQPIATELSGIVVTSARGAQRIESEPLRVEVLAGDDVAEKTEMRPSDLTKFLSEMAGVRVQQLSASTGASSVRLQGLRPRYTLLLADGLPLYGSAGTGLDLMQLPPADLRQIEVVKGPASAMYGASALGGMINLISKRPGREEDALMQATSERGTNAFGWSSRQVGDLWGYTAVVGGHTQAYRDMDGDGWVDLPHVERIEARPRFFFDWPSGHTMFVTAGFTTEARQGGFVFPGVSPQYIESVGTNRGDAGLVGHFLSGPNGLIQIRAAANINDERKMFGLAPETIHRSTAFGELSYSHTGNAHDVLVGAALNYDGNRVDEEARSEYNFGTGSAFAQDAWRITRNWSLTTSARLDAHSRYGPFFSPRISLLRQITKGWTARASATHGFYAPTPYIEEAQQVGIRRIRDFETVGAETADYAAVDVNGHQGPVEINATVFGSAVRHQVTSTFDEISGTIGISNALAKAQARGVETFLVYDLDPLFVTALYTFTDSDEPADATSTTTKPATYLPRHAGGIDITWEKRDTWIALEAFYTGSQPLDRDPYLAAGKPYTTVTLLATRRFGRYKVFANIENLTDVRQSDYEPILLPAPRRTGEYTTRVWAPLEGRVFSLGFRVSTGDLVQKED